MTAVKVRIHYLQHVPFEGLGSIRNLAEERNCALTTTRCYRGEPYPKENFERTNQRRR